MPDGQENNSADTPAQPGINTPEQKAAPEGLPEGLPESFWDAEAKAVKVDDLVKSYADLNKFKTDQEAALSKRPESPDKYELKLPETFEMPEGMGFTFEADSELAKLGRDLAHAKGLDQEGFVNEILTPYVQHEMAKAQQAQTEAEEFYKTEKAKLGEKADDRINAVDAYLKANFTPEQAEALSGAAITAPGVEAIEKLIGIAAGPQIKTGDAGAGANAITQEKLAEMQQDPRYLSDPAFFQQVQDGYAKLYPGKQQRIQ